MVVLLQVTLESPAQVHFDGLVCELKKGTIYFTAAKDFLFLQGTYYTRPHRVSERWKIVNN